MKSPAPSKAKWIALGLFVFAVFFSAPVFSAESSDTDIWTEDTDQMQQGPWSDRRIDGFLSRLEQVNPERAAELRKLQKEDPDKFMQALNEEAQKMFRASGNRPRPQESMQGPRGPMGPGPQAQGPDSMGSRRGGPDEGRGGEGRGGRWQERLQRRHDEFIQWLEKNDPELAGELAKLRETDEAAYFGRYMEARRKYDPILRAERDNPELATVLLEDLALQKQRDDLLRELRGTEGAKREQLIKDLKRLVSKRFDLIIRKKTLQYQELEERLKRLQKELEKRQAEVQKLQNNKEQAVEEHVKDLTTQAEKINWD